MQPSVPLVCPLIGNVLLRYSRCANVSAHEQIYMCEEIEIAAMSLAQRT